MSTRQLWYFADHPHACPDCDRIIGARDDRCWECHAELLRWQYGELEDLYRGRVERARINYGVRK